MPSFDQLKYIGSIDFDIFKLKQESGGQELLSVQQDISIKEEIFTQFWKEISELYHNNPYHNSTHAADVSQTIYWVLSTAGFIEKARLDSLETIACYFAAGIHDVDHPALNNSFLINTRNELAIRYNDISVLENHHIATAFKCGRNMNLFHYFKKDEYKKFRKLVIQMVLATDMSKHFSSIGKFRGKIDSENESFVEQNKNQILEIIMHACDISNPCKP